MYCSFQGDKFPVDLVAQPMANGVEFRHEPSQPTAGIISGVTGPGSSRMLIPSLSMEHHTLLGFLHCTFENVCFLLMFYLYQPCFRTWFAWTSGQAWRQLCWSWLWHAKRCSRHETWSRYKRSNFSWTSSDIKATKSSISIFNNAAIWRWVGRRWYNQQNSDK